MNNKFVYTRCSRGYAISVHEMAELLMNKKEITPLYLVHKIISMKKLYEVLGLNYTHKESIVNNKMISYFRSKLKGEKVFMVYLGGIFYLFEKEKPNV